MESTKTKPDAKDAMSEDEDGRDEEVRRPTQTAVRSDAPGYFHIYKKGQGYWTRMGTVAGAALIGLLSGNFLYTQCERLLVGPKITPFLDAHHLSDPRAPFLVVAIFALLYAWIAFHFMNKPASVDFLIATDSEMKKVNWTTQKELLGSTKIVIWFVFVMATLLFTYDLFFQFLFWLVGVLSTKPFFLGK
jgi:preprotein translocase SecE subunit